MTIPLPTAAQALAIATAELERRGAAWTKSVAAAADDKRAATEAQANADLDLWWEITCMARRVGGERMRDSGYPRDAARCLASIDATVAIVRKRAAEGKADPQKAHDLSNLSRWFNHHMPRRQSATAQPAEKAAA